ncbi:MAG: DUF5011 domain-containing protein [Chitinophagales bacterium]|nr:DUF5011 domain-containing protein [Chitinophagales bacterium]
MKTLKNIFYASILLSLVGIVSCSKDKDPEPSKITYLPVISLEGESLVIVPLGVDFVDDGANAEIEGEPADYSTNSNVDVNSPGVYIVKYTAKNTDGFTASVERTVIVAEPFVDGAADLSGTYAREANGRLSKLTKIVDGVYSMSDGWGSASSGGNPLPVPAYIFCPDGVNITMPLVTTVFGGMTGSGTFDGDRMSINTILVDQGPVARVNVWIKQ